MTGMKKNTVSILYAFGKTDSRLIYYAKTPIKKLEESELKLLLADKQLFFVLVEDDDASKMLTFAGWEIKEFKPYLKKKKSLMVFGFGDVCNNSKQQLN